MSDTEQNVTFVGGKAIEQHDAPDTNLDADTREDAKEAVRRAIEEAGEEAKENTEMAEKATWWKPGGVKVEAEDKRGPDVNFQ
jgi:hypothetical protein